MDNALDLTPKQIEDLPRKQIIDFEFMAFAGEPLLNTTFMFYEPWRHWREELNNSFMPGKIRMQLLTAERYFHIVWRKGEELFRCYLYRDETQIKYGSEAERILTAARDALTNCRLDIECLMASLATTYKAKDKAAIRAKVVKQHKILVAIKEDIIDHEEYKRGEMKRLSYLYDQLRALPILDLAPPRELRDDIP